MITPTISDIKYYSRDAIAISWELSNPDLEPFIDYKLEIYRSGSPDDGFRFIARPNMEDLFYVDCAADTRSRNARHFYKIVVTDRITSDSTESIVDWIRSEPDCIALDIIRKERLLLKCYLKNKCWIYIPRLSGPKCSNCYDTYMGRRTTDECKHCYGTGFECGFYSPIESYIKINPDPKVMQASNFGPLEPKQTDAWITSWPLIPVNTYIFEIETGDRWRVSQITTTQKSRYVIRQLLRLTGEDRGSIIYDIKLPNTFTEPW